ncbi:hypothetical protein IWQ47_001277 [Aquimarina sp. EL_43]|uniref:hypothetical protein n=1 Tax=unclassified Aquimarina TaxID=2627091 RepID=UPI0018CB76A0|nr:MULTISPECIES: hypothetical protein [unclassified Aquimarina]MBG6129420.1 hypothetical protein [Aquimarina sp. EL_35]MBG6150485.1 hypothetical protein [Aquimarina sp. EL_32]MBG6168207.1 hypothetical protein [Aquimarina sp. EL_43]
MKSIITLLLCILSLSIATAQDSNRINYQAIVRDVNNTVLQNTDIGVQINILQTSASGSSVYSETQNATTNINGLINIIIGSATGFDSIDWGNGSYFIKIEIDPTGGTNYVISTVNQLLSVPYALHAATADFAETADYNALTNTPTTITAAQSAKIDFITISSAVDINQLQTDVTANNAKTSFPGFGTVPGTALEGNNLIWTKSTNDIFYNTGNVGIGVDQSSSFGDAKLHVSGPILFDGTPATTVPGTLYYDSTGNGSFHYTDNTNTSVLINSGGVTYNSGLWTVENGDAVISSDVIMQSSLGVGQDMNVGQDFGFNTIILKENNLRLLFDDSDDISGTMPANDWQIEANSSTNGGTSHFAIVDATAGVTPFKILAGAPESSLYVAANGNVGIGVNSPTEKLEVAGAVKANTFIGDGSGITGIATGTGGVANAGNTTIAADTDANTVGEISFQTQNTTRMTITNTGAVGVGTTSPSADLEVAGDVKVNDLTINGNANVQTMTLGTTVDTSVTPFPPGYNVTDKSLIILDGQVPSSLRGFTGGVTGQTITITALTSAITIQHEGVPPGLGSVSLPGNADIVLPINGSATFVFDGTFWYCVGLNN